MNFTCVHFVHSYLRFFEGVTTLQMFYAKLWQQNYYKGRYHNYHFITFEFISYDVSFKSIMM